MTTQRDEDRLSKLAEKIKGSNSPAEIAKLVRLLEPVSPVGKMNSTEFENLMQTLQAKSSRRGFTEKSIEAARLVLVMGASASEAAAETALTRQAVSQLMQRIERHREAVPQDWAKIENWFPADVAKQLQALAKQLQGLQEKGKAIDGIVIDFKPAA